MSVSVHLIFHTGAYKFTLYIFLCDFVLKTPNINSTNLLSQVVRHQDAIPHVKKGSIPCVDLEKKTIYLLDFYLVINANFYYGNTYIIDDNDFLACMVIL